MKYVIDLTALNDNFSGIERYALNMTLELLKQGNIDDTFELVFKNEVFRDFIPWKKNENIHYHVLPGCKKLLFNQWRLPRYLNQLNADYYLFFAFPMPIFLKKSKVLGTIHDLGCWDCPETMKKQMVWYFRISNWWMTKRAEKIITISEFSKNRIKEILKVPDSKVLVAYCAVSGNFSEMCELQYEQQIQIKKKYHLPDEYYLCLSTLEPRKNMLFLLRAYLELYNEGKIKTKLVLAGRKGWKIDELLEKVDAEKDNQVVVTGFIEDQDLPAVYRMAKCFLFPSVYEGFGIPPLEAMAQGVPVISSDASSLPEVLGRAAIYFKNNDAEHLKKRILEFEQKEEQDVLKYKKRGIIQSHSYEYAKEAEKIRIYCEEKSYLVK